MFQLAHTSQGLFVRPAIFAAVLVLSLVCSAAQTRADLGDCGQPISTGASPVATDALFLLGAAVGTQTCDLCVCDVNDDAAITATDALIDLNAAVGQAVSLDCSSCAIECPQDDGCELREGMVAEDEPLVLQTSGGQVTVPANALPEGIIVTLREMTPDLADSLPDGPGEELLSNIFDFTLSDAVQPTAPIVLDVSVPIPAPTHFRGQVRAMGSPSSTELTAEEWLVEIGRFDAATSRLAFTQLGAFDHVYAAVVVPTGGAAADAERTRAGGQQDTARNVAQPEPHPSETAPAPTRANAVTSKLGARGWAVACLPELYTFVGDPSCEGDGMFGPLPPLFADLLSNADLFIFGLGLRDLRAQVVTRGDMERSLMDVGYSDPLGVSGEDPSAEYYLAYMIPFLEGARGDYQIATGRIRIVGTGGIILPSEESTTAHELMHAVQFGTAPEIGAARWILEGVADAVGHGFIDLDLESRLAYRRGDNPRDWNLVLNTTEGDNEYRTSELWFSAGSGDLGYLEPFYEILAMSGGTSDGESYMQANDAFFWALSGGGLADRYITLLKDRDDDDYRYCTSITCSPGSSCRTDHQSDYPLPLS